MDYRWRYTNRHGAVVPGPDEAFDEQQEAEAWLTDNFGELAASGIDQVTLLEGTRVVYGPMSLHPS
ncbi:hypothetical protein EV191_102298 [Tamaricihabitans halophyticus]|uniref:Uncharacterized protein n=1 Tax=Tamaricihabitans halophyticus TaxID=1262583 RepID=A0A4V2SUL5_9PSEU|nr:hypothetical protein [Tamaricihabitans halophyticus]TCP55086.1 hypothetical protein EV191_102298 [Tamaricihabitans halophyticus]